MTGESYDQRPALPVDAVLLAGAVHLPTGALAASAPVYSRGCILLGWVLRERAGTPALAQLDLLDGGNSGGELIAPVSLAASGMSVVWFGPPGVQVKSGIYANVLAGTLGGTLFILPEQ